MLFWRWRIHRSILSGSGLSCRWHVPLGPRPIFWNRARINADDFIYRSPFSLSTISKPSARPTFRTGRWSFRMDFHGFSFHFVAIYLRLHFFFFFEISRVTWWIWRSARKSRWITSSSWIASAWKSLKLSTAAPSSSFSPTEPPDPKGINKFSWIQFNLTKFNDRPDPKSIHNWNEINWLDGPKRNQQMKWNKMNTFLENKVDERK